MRRATGTYRALVALLRTIALVLIVVAASGCGGLASLRGLPAAPAARAHGDHAPRARPHLVLLRVWHAGRALVGHAAEPLERRDDVLADDLSGRRGQRSGMPDRLQRSRACRDGPQRALTISRSSGTSD